MCVCVCMCVCAWGLQKPWCSTRFSLVCVCVCVCARVCAWGLQKPGFSTRLSPRKCQPPGNLGSACRDVQTLEFHCVWLSCATSWVGTILGVTQAFANVGGGCFPLLLLMPSLPFEQNLLESWKVIHSDLHLETQGLGSQCEPRNKGPWGPVRLPTAT